MGGGGELVIISRDGDTSSHLMMLRALHDAFRGLRVPLTEDEVTATALGLLNPAGAIGATLVLVGEGSPDAPESVTAAAAGINRQFKRMLCPLTLDSPVPAIDAIRHRRSIFLGTRDEILEHYPVYEEMDDSVHAIAALALGEAARPIGALAVSFAQPMAFTMDLRVLLDEVADVAAHLLARGSHSSSRARMPDGTTDLGTLSLDRTGRRVWVDGQAIDLSRLEYELLGVLVDHRAQVLSKGQLLSHVWGYDGYNDNVVEAQISSLRRKLGTAATLIETVRGFGYVVR